MHRDMVSKGGVQLFSPLGRGVPLPSPISPLLPTRQMIFKVPVHNTRLPVAK